MGRRVIAIVGDGPRLTYLLSAMALLADEFREVELLILHGSDQPGAGWVHDPRLPAELTMNRLARQLSFGPDETCRGWEGIASTPASLAARLEVAERTRELAEGFPSRALHGEFLRSALSGALAALRLAIPVSMQRVTASHVRPTPGGVRIEGGGRRWLASECLLLTGHGETPAFYRHFGYGLGEMQSVEILGAGASGLDLALHAAQSGRVGLVRHVSRSGQGPWPRPVFIRMPPSIPTPHLDALEERDRRISTIDLVAGVAAETLHSYLTLAGQSQVAADLSTLARDMIAAGADSDSVRARVTEQLNRITPEDLRSDFPWEALTILLGEEVPEGDRSARATRQRLAAAETGYGVDPGVTAIESVLRDARPRLCELTTADRAVDRGEVFSRLVGAMNRLVNGPAPQTVRRYLELVEQGRIVPSTSRTEEPGSIRAEVHPLTGTTVRGPLAACLTEGIASEGVVFRVGETTHVRLAVDDNFALQGPKTNGRIFAIGPNVDSGELLHASAMRPGCDHTVMRDITSWLIGLQQRNVNNSKERIS